MKNPPEIRGILFSIPLYRRMARLSSLGSRPHFSATGGRSAANDTCAEAHPQSMLLYAFLCVAAGVVCKIACQPHARFGTQRPMANPAQELVCCAFPNPAVSRRNDGQQHITCPYPLCLFDPARCGNPTDGPGALAIAHRAGKKAVCLSGKRPFGFHFFGFIPMRSAALRRHPVQRQAYLPPRPVQCSRYRPDGPCPDR